MITNSVFQLGIIEFAQPKGHWFVILDNVGSPLIAGGISVNVKEFIVIRVSKEANTCHECFRAFEGWIHVTGPEKRNVFFPDLLERGAKMCAH